MGPPIWFLPLSRCVPLGFFRNCGLSQFLTRSSLVSVRRLPTMLLLNLNSWIIGIPITIFRFPIATILTGNLVPWQFVAFLWGRSGGILNSLQVAWEWGISFFIVDIKITP